MIKIVRDPDDREHPGTWDYRIPEFGVGGRSRQPLLDACRQIKRMGGDPARLAALSREGCEHWDIRCSVEVGASTTVEDPDRGQIRFRPFKAFAALETTE